MIVMYTIQICVLLFIEMSWNYFVHFAITRPMILKMSQTYLFVSHNDPQTWNHK